LGKPLLKPAFTVSFGELRNDRCGCDELHGMPRQHRFRYQRDRWVRLVNRPKQQHVLAIGYRSSGGWAEKSKPGSIANEREASEFEGISMGITAESSRGLFCLRVPLGCGTIEAARQGEIRENPMDDSPIEATRRLCDDLDGFIEVAKLGRAPIRALSLIERARADLKAYLDDIDAAASAVVWSGLGGGQMTDWRPIATAYRWYGRPAALGYVRRFKNVRSIGRYFGLHGAKLAEMGVCLC